MVSPKEFVLDRIEQSFSILKNNFILIVSAFLIFDLLTRVVFSNILFYSTMSFLDLTSIEEFSFETFGEIYNNIAFQLGISILILSAVIFLLLTIPIIIGTIKSIGQAYTGEKVTPKENIAYGYKNLLNSFKVYWYIFAYVALIPCIAIILSLLIILTGIMTTGGDGSFNDLSIIGIVILSVSFFYLAIMAIYRGTKATFSMIMAVDNEDYEKQRFINSIKITKGKWWRIFGNLFLVGLIVGICIGMLSWTVNILTSLLGTGGFSDISFKDLNNKPLNEVLGELTTFNPFLILGQTINTILTTIGKVFIMVFSFVFYKRLVLESEKNNSIKKAEEL